MERASEVQNLPELELPSNEPREAGFADKLKNLFGMSPSNSSGNQSPNQSAAGSSPESSQASETISKPLAAPVESELSKVPDLIGAEAAPGEASSEVESWWNCRRKVASMNCAGFGYVDPDTVADVVEGSFSYLAERFESEHWKLKPRNRDSLGRTGAAWVDRRDSVGHGSPA